MTNTPNLDIEHLQPNAAQPEVVVNEALDAFDAKITAPVVVDITSLNSASLTQDEQAAGSIFIITPSGSPGPSAAIAVAFAPFGMGNFTVVNDTAFPVTLEVSGQPLPIPVLGVGSTGIFCNDGTNVRAVAGGTTTGILASLMASEDLAAGDLVSLHNSGGATKMRLADATDDTKPAHGFVKSAVLTGATGLFFGSGQMNDAVAGLTDGAVYYLDTAGGQVTAVAPSVSGNIVQEVGVALSPTSLAFFPKGSVLL